MTTPPPLPPPHPPLSVPAPPTLNLPPDVVDKLAPPPHGVGDWFYTNGATLLGVLAAIVAAAIAWYGVQRQIKAEAQRLTKQIDAENNRQKRKDTMDALTNAASVVTEAWMLAFKNLDGGRSVADVVSDAVDLQTKMATVIARLDLLGLANERDKVSDYWGYAENADTIQAVEALKTKRKFLVDFLTEPITD
jgi:hypothetical protein